MSFRDIDINISYGPADDRLRAFYLPLLSESVRYDRSAGYFSSTVLAVAACGVARLIENGGKMRLLVGADLYQNDVEAIQRGQSLEGIVHEKLLAAFREPEDRLMKKRFEVLAWMISEGTLEIKVVLPTDAQGKPVPAPSSLEYYHPKEGIFADRDGNEVAFSGSVNESETAWINNYEQFSVYKSWDASRPYLAQVAIRFDRLWGGEEKDWIALDIPKAVEEKLLKYRTLLAPSRDALEPAEPQKVDVGEIIGLQYIKDAPYLKNGAGLGFATSAIEPWPHQAKVAKQAVGLYPAGRLLADEVGLGKTIEIGLILRELLIRGIARRVLILVPKSLTRQWQEELYEKFALDIPLYDGSAFTNVWKEPLETDGDSPWNAFPVMIASCQLVRHRNRWQDFFNAQNWDLVIVDEAHHARRREFLTDRYRPNRMLEMMNKLVAEKKAKCLLMATATPMQIHRVEVWDLLKLLGLSGRWGASSNLFVRFFEELGKPFDETNWQFVLTLVRDYLDTGAQIDRRFEKEAEESVGPATWLAIKSLADSRDANSVVQGFNTKGQAVLKKFVTLHTPVRKLVYRHTRPLLRMYKQEGLFHGDIPERDPQEIWIPMNTDERELYDRIDEYFADFYQKYESERKGLGFVMSVYRRRLTSSFYAMEKSLERRLEFLRGDPDAEPQGLTEEDREQEELSNDFEEEYADSDIYREEIDYVVDFVSELRQLGSDSKHEQLLNDVANILARRNTVLIFTLFTDTMDYLRDKLRTVYGSQVACFSGRGGEFWNGSEWERTTKEKIKNRFAEGDEIKIMICTEAASEGLNLQTCGVLINYDMPWNPMRVEQRIGRIDRIGQQYERVWILNYFYDETVEADIYKALSTRINWFEEVVGELQPIISRVPRAIEKVAMTRKSERERVLRAEVEELERRLDQREKEYLQLDMYLDKDLASTGTANTPLSISEIGDYLKKGSATKSLIGPHPTIEGAYEVEVDGSRHGITFSRQLYDQHPDTLQFMTYGNPLFDRLLASAITDYQLPHGAPGKIIRLSSDRPYPMVDYYCSREGEMKRIESLQELLELIATSYCEDLDDSLVSAALDDFTRRISCEVGQIKNKAKEENASIRLTLAEEGRIILKQAALVEIARAQHSTLFDVPQDFSFDIDAVYRLSRRGYPFAGLLKLAGTDGIEISPTDSYYMSIQDKNEDALGREFASASSQAGRILTALAGTEKESTDEQEDYLGEDSIKKTVFTLS